MKRFVFLCEIIQSDENILFQLLNDSNCQLYKVKVKFYVLLSITIVIISTEILFTSKSIPSQPAQLWAMVPAWPSKVSFSFRLRFRKSSFNNPEPKLQPIQYFTELCVNEQFKFDQKPKSRYRVIVSLNCFSPSLSWVLSTQTLLWTWTSADSRATRELHANDVCSVTVVAGIK